MDGGSNSEKTWSDNLYRPLGLSRRVFCVRLLQILPGEFQATLQCKLMRTTLLDAPTYDALSYTWGSLVEGHSVDINGVRVPITANLERALRDLRHNTQQSMLWVDALCINQSDVHERNSQVREMGIIYSSARNVVVHLGPPVEQLDGPVDGVKRMFLQHPNASSPANSVTGEISDLDAARNCSAMNELLDRPWWKRVWVVQEACRSRKDPIVCIGPDQYIDLFDIGSSLPESDFSWMNVKTKGDISKLRREMSAQELDQKIKELEQKRRATKEMPRSRKRGKTRDALQQISVFMDVRRRTRLPPRMRETTVERDAREEMRRRLGEDLMYLLEATQHFDSTDPRDKIFAIWTLARGTGEDRLQPDYSMSMRQVYKAATIELINGAAGLKILDRRWGQPVPSLPSWVPDYSIAAAAVPAFSTAFSLSQRDINPEHSAVPKVTGGEPSVLTASGFVLGTVIKVISMRPPFDSRKLEAEEKDLATMLHQTRDQVSELELTLKMTLPRDVDESLKHVEQLLSNTSRMTDGHLTGLRLLEGHLRTLTRETSRRHDVAHASTCMTEWRSHQCRFRQASEQFARLLSGNLSDKLSSQYGAGDDPNWDTIDRFMRRVGDKYRGTVRSLGEGRVLASEHKIHQYSLGSKDNVLLLNILKDVQIDLQDVAKECPTSESQPKSEAAASWIRQKRHDLETQAAEVMKQGKDAHLCQILRLQGETWKGLEQLLADLIDEERAWRHSADCPALMAYETISGLLGFGSEDLRGGDLLVELEGYESLCILRRVENTDEDPEYTFRGRAWLHVPDGDTKIQSRLLHLERQTFHIV